MPAATLELRLPPGRIVQGDLYKVNTTDLKGNPLLVKQGARKGQPTQNVFVAIAIPKTAADNGHWANTAWGQQLWNLGHGSWPQGQAQRKDFAWKVEDGDSPEPNQRMRKNCETEGMPGCWIVNLSSNFAPKVVDAQGNPLAEPGLVKRGFWVEAFITSKSNENSDKPGLYLNHSVIAFRAPDKEISSGPDPRALGFGQAPLPAGVSNAPPASVAPAVPGSSGAPPPPGGATHATPPPGAAVPPTPGNAGAPPPPATAVVPNTAYMVPPGATPPATAVAPPPPPTAAPVSGRQWLGPAGSSEAQYLAGGWTEAQLVQNGLLKL